MSASFQTDDDFQAFACQLLTEPTVKIALANGSLFKPFLNELHTVYDTLSAECESALPVSQRDPGRHPFLSYADAHHISLVKALWVSQLARRLESGAYIDATTLSDEELEIFLRTGLQ